MKRLWALIVVLAGLGVLADALLGRAVPGLTAGIGLVGCVVIILVSKWLGRSMLQRHEEYYE